MKNERIYKMTFAKVYPMYLQKAERKGRTKNEVDTIICWLTGYSEQELQSQIEKEIDVETFFHESPSNSPKCQ